MSRPGEPLLLARDLTVDFGGPPVLRGVSLRLEAGQIVALLGSDGAGRSVLLRCLAGFTRSETGEIAVAGTPLHRARRRRHVPVLLVPDTPTFWDDLTVEEHLAFAGLARGQADWRVQAEPLLARLGLQGCARQVPAACSAAHRQRLAIAIGLLARPQVLLLDEPFAHLDAAGAAAVWTLLRGFCDAGRAVLLSGSLPAGARADRCVLLAHGQVAAEGPQCPVAEGG